MFFASSHAALRANLSWCKVSSCDIFSNFGAPGLRLPRDGPFFQSFYLVPSALNFTVCFDPNSPGSRGIDFLGKEP